MDVGTGRTVIGVAVGELHTCALLDDASAKCWGSAAEGQLGYESTFGRGGHFFSKHGQGKARL